MHTNRTENAWKEKKESVRLAIHLQVIATNHTHQSLVFERVVHGPKKQPERPKKLEPKLQHEISDYHNDP